MMRGEDGPSQQEFQGTGGFSIMGKAKKNQRISDSHGVHMEGGGKFLKAWPGHGEMKPKYRYCSTVPYLICLPPKRDISTSSFSSPIPCTCSDFACYDVKIW